MSSLALPPLREVIARHGLTASKALGQNFLLDEQLLDRIAAIPGDLKGQQVLEVGPGPGGLTRALLRAGAQVTAIEMDRRCLPALAELGEAFPGQLRVIEGDAMKVAHGIEGPFHVAANLPYNVGTSLFVRWLSGEQWPPQWASLTLMFQLEVAERIVAKAGGDAYGRLAVLAQWRSASRIAMKVHRSAFTPPPKVMSAVIHVEPAEMPEGVSARMLERLTEAAFGQRRKMLRQSLKGLPGALDALEKLGIDAQRRAETLDVAEFVAIARALSGWGARPMGEQEAANVAVVKQFYAILAQGDRDGAYAACMADDYVLHEAASLPYGGVYPGRELMKATLSGVTGSFDEFTYEILNYLAGGDEVVVHLHMSGVGRKSRKPFSLPVMELWRFRDGKAIEMRPFLYDSAALIAALDL